LADEQWAAMLQMLPVGLDLEATAKETKALVRKREIKTASDLLRLVFAYVVCDWSLRLVGVWCAVLQLAHLSDTAILKRLRHCPAWLGKIIALLLEEDHVQLSQFPDVHVRLMDATGASRPGSSGTDWVIHASLDLGRMCLDGVELTDAHGAETMARYPPQANEIRVGDRGYAYAKSMGPVLASGSGLVVRINWQSVPLEHPEGNKVDLIAYLRSISPQQPVVEHSVWMQTPQGRFPLRLIVAMLPQEAADRARQRIYKACRRKGKTPDARTLFAAGFTMVVSNLAQEPWPAEQVLRLYRLRWQVELLFKRLKSLLHLDHLRAQDPQLAQTYLLGKLLAALLLDRLTCHARRLCPEWFQSLTRPVSVWRLTALLYDTFRNLVRGEITLVRLFQALPHLGRFLRDPPRRRPQQLAQARSFLHRLSFCQGAAAYESTLAR
jgi:hypothetical protein